MSPSRSLFAELRRRNVFRAAAFYLAAAWLIAQVVTQILPVFAAPDWWLRWVIVALVVGFPFWIAFAWFYEFTPEGLKRESEIEPHESITHHTGRKLDFAIIGVLALAVVLLLTDRFVLRQGVNQQAAIPVPEQSIAVLPFADMSPEKDQQYFSDGISEELLNLLAKIPQLQVTARTSSFAFKGKEIGIAEIARQLRVAHVLEGSVRKSGDQVRITAQLINAATDAHLWSQTYDRKLDDIFAIQDEIAADVVKQLEVTLLGAVPKAHATDPEAYALYLQARQLGRQHTAVAYKESDALYHKVLAIDPRFAPAWNGLSTNLANEVAQGLIPSREGFTQSRDAAMEALAIDPDHAPALASLGYVAMSANNDLASAAHYFQRALALDPAEPRVLGGSATLLQNLGQLDEALALREALARRDPVNVASLFNLGGAQRSAGRFDAAIASFRTVLSLSPGYSGTYAEFGNALLLKDDAAGALAEIERETSEVWRMLGLPMAYHALGREADSDAALAALTLKYKEEAPYNIAYAYSFRGEADKAFSWLDTAVEYGDPGLTEIAVENLFANIHADPRWLPFLRKIGRAPEQLAKIKFNVTLPDAGEWAAESAPDSPAAGAQ